MTTRAATWSMSGLPGDSTVKEWTKQLSDVHVPWELSFPDHRRFNAAVRYRRLDRLTIAEFRSGPFTGHRAEGCEEPVIGVLVNTAGRVVCRYASGEEVLLEPRHLLVWDSEQAAGFAGVEPHRQLYVLFPRDRAPHRLAVAARQAAHPVPAGAGSGLAAVAADQLRSITREFDHLTDDELTIACQAFHDTLEAALAPETEQRPCGVRSSLLTRIRSHIEENLDNPELSTSSIAAAHGVSVRTVNLAFADVGTTATRWIRDRRLRVCYRDLSLSGPGMTVTDVAFRWGFNSAAHFSTVFKHAFGVTPSSVLARARGAA